MNNEQQSLIAEAYKNYLQHYADEYNEERKKLQNPLYWMEMEYTNIRPYPKEEFINKCKNDKDFSEKWGLKIDERELSLEERAKLLSIKIEHEIKETPLHGEGQFETEVTQDANAFNIQTRLIIVTYQNKTIESYENQ
jgi:hypothetical protein